MKEKQKRHLGRTTFFLTVIGAWITLSGAAGAQTPPAGGQWGVCAECHKETAATFGSTFHGRAWSGESREAGCSSCHGPADKHKTSPGKETILTFGEKSQQTAEEQAGQCLACHGESAELTFWDMGAHKKNDVACVACHDIHQSRSTVQQPEVCFGCHRDVRSDANKVSHHPIIEGKVKCSDCHNTHGALAPHMIRAEDTNQLCYKCHADKRGPFVWTHPPVEEDCLICHTPHGGRHEALLVEKMVNLCQDCHDSSGHEARAFDAAHGFDGSESISNKRRFLGRACLECHHAIHGSANFRRTFTR